MGVSAFFDDDRAKVRTLPEKARWRDRPGLLCVFGASAQIIPTPTAEAI